MNNRLAVYVLAIFSIVLWGSSYIWSDKLIALGIPIFFFVPVRIFIAGIVLLLFNLASGAFKAIAKRDIWKFAVVALCEPLIYFLCETYGILETGSPTISAVVIATVPIFSVTAGFLLFKERITAINITGIAITLGGICLVILTQNSEFHPRNLTLGIILLMVAVLSEVCYASMTKILAKDYTPHVIVMHQFLIGSIYFLPIFLTKGIENFEPRYVSWEVMEPILSLAVLCSSIAFSIWALAIKRLGVGKSSVFLAMMCVTTALIAEIIGREHLSVIQWCGVIVSVAGIILSQRASGSASHSLSPKKEKEPVSESFSAIRGNATVVNNDAAI